MNRTPTCLMTVLLSLAAALIARADPGKPAVAWRAIGPGEFGAMFGVGISPHDSKVIVAGGDMGFAFMTRDGGQHWRMLGRSGGDPFANPGYRGVWAVHFDPLGRERVFIGSTHGLFRSTDEGETWRIVLGGDAGNVIGAITTDPTDSNIVYAASGMGARMNVGWSLGKVWKSADGSGTWKDITPRDLPGRCNWVTIAADPQSPVTAGQGHSRVYLCGQGGLYVSEDAGRDWTSLTKFLPDGGVHLNQPGPHDSGASTLVLAPGAKRSRLFITLKARQTSGGPLGGVYRSDDGGRTWAERNRGLEGAIASMAKAGREYTYSLLVGCRAKPNVMYWANYPHGVFRTSDGGETWRPLLDLKTEWFRAPDFDGRQTDWLLRRHGGNFAQSYYNAFGPANGLACSATDPEAVAYTDNAGLGVSFDGGKHWTEPGFEYGEAFRPNAFGDRPPMRLTHKVRSRGLQLIVPMCLAVDPFDRQTIAIGHEDVGLVISRDGGRWWEWAWHGMLEGERNNILAIIYDPAVRGRLWAGGGGWNASGHVYQSDDAGRTFRRIGIPPLTAEAQRSKRELYVHALALGPTLREHTRPLYAGTDFGLFRTTDGGLAWQAIPLGSGPAPHVRHLRVDPAGSGRLYAAVEGQPEGAGGLYGSSDGGQHWTRLGSGAIGAVRSLSLCEATGTLYVLGDSKPAGGVFASRTLWRSDDHGLTWMKLDQRPAACAGADPRDPRRVYLVSYAGDVTRGKVNVYRSADRGRSWAPVGDAIPLSPGGDGNQVVFDPTNPARLFVLHNSGTFEAIEETP